MTDAPRFTVLHITAAPGGGVDRYIRDLAASTTPAHVIWHVGAGTDVIEEVSTHRFLPIRDISGDRDGIALLTAWLRGACVGIVHLHSVGEACRARLRVLEAAMALPFVVTLHDLTFINPLAFDAPGMPQPDPEWLVGVDGMLGRAAVVIAPSDFIRDVAARCVPGLRTVMIPPGIRETVPAHTLDPPANFQADAPRHVVAVVGAIGPHKGSRLLDGLAMALEGTDIGIAVVGYTDQRFTAGWVAAGLYFVLGPYIDDELPSWLAALRAEIVLFPNRVPESFSYTLSEVWAAGIPVIVPDGGALGERVAQHGGGWRLPQGFGATEAAAMLKRLCSADGAIERAQVKSSLSALDNERVPRLDTMARDTDALYARFALTPPERAATAGDEALAPLLAANLDGFVFRKELVALTTELARVKAASADEQRIERFEGEAAAARAWAEKLEADIAELKREIARLDDANRRLGDDKAAFDLLPKFARRLLLRKAFRARG